MAAFIASLLSTAFVTFLPMMLTAAGIMLLWLGCRFLLWPGAMLLTRSCIWTLFFIRELARNPADLLVFIFLTLPGCIIIALLFILAFPICILAALPYYLAMACIHPIQFFSGSFNDRTPRFLFQLEERLQAKAQFHPSKWTGLQPGKSQQT